VNLGELSHGSIERAGSLVLHAGSVPLPAAGVTGIVGVNGAGKTTLMHALAGALRHGRARIRAGDAELRAPLGYAPQQAAFPAWLHVPDVVRLYGGDYEALCAEMPGLLLDELRDTAVQALSVGQEQALSVALALATHGQLTLLDEPFAPLDFRRRIGLLQLLRARRGEAAGGVTLVSSQSAADLLDTCEWIVVLRAGRYLHSGATTALTAGVADPAEARQRFEEAVMALLGAASPHPSRRNGRLAQRRAYTSRLPSRR
jgi:ABC-type multidrug transport system ATPase subunit